MAVRKNTRNPRRRRTFKRRRATYGNRPIRGRMTGWADALKTKLVYAEQIVFAPIGVNQTYFYSGNSAYDPDQSGVGRMPIGNPQWGAFYEKYRVLASRCEVTIVSTQTTSGPGNINVILAPQQSNNVTLNMMNAAANSYAKYIVGAPVSAGGNPVKVTNYMTSSKIFGVRPSAIKSEDDYSGELTSSGFSPPNMWYWCLTVGTMDQSTNVQCHGFVKITYYCELYGRHVLTQAII